MPTDAWWQRYHMFLMAPILIGIFFFSRSVFGVSFPTESHLVMELPGIIMGGLIFILIWYSYDRIPHYFRMFGFMYLIIAMLHITHILRYDYYSTGAEDLSLQLVTVGRVLESLAFFIISFRLPLRLNKWAALLLSLTIGLAIIFKLLIFHEYLPPLYTSEGYTSLKYGLEAAILLIICINIYLLRNRVLAKDIISYRHIFSALLINAFHTLFFTLQAAPDTAWSIMGHVFRIAFYYHLFKGIFANAIIYPYEKLEEVLDHLPLAVVTFDHNSTLTFGNKKAGEIMDMELAQVKGQSLNQIANIVLPGLTPLQPINEILQSGSVEQQIVTIQNVHNKSLKIVADLYPLKSGGSLCIFDTASKVQEIQNLRLQTQIILNSLNHAVIILDTCQKIVMCNKAACEITELDSEEIIDHEVSDFATKLGISCPELLDVYTNLQPMANSQQVELQTASGKTKAILLQYSQIKDLDEEIIGWIGIGSDITSLKKEQFESQQQEKLALLGQMATGIVHEIRNPITAIMGFLHLLNKRLEDEKLREYCQYIERESNTLNGIVTDFLQFARPRSPIFKPVKVNSLVTSLMMMIDSNIFPLGIRSTYDLQPFLPVINADENKIKQVIMNIVKNAIDALKDNPEPKIIIETGYKPASNEVFIAITNNGPHISPETIEKLGIPFFTTKAKGTGLGLSICNQIITDHQGRLVITSDRQAGTRMEICFPQLEVELSQAFN